MDMMSDQGKEFEEKDQRKAKLQSLVVIAFFAVAFIVFINSGLRELVTRENLRELGSNPLAALLIIVAMTAAWTFALPASVFFFVTPLLFPPLASTGIICAGSVAGSTMGYVAARFGGSPWFQRFNNSRITKFLGRHSTFSTLFAIRVFPSSPHMFINYGAGLLRIPYFKFIIATIIGIGIKAFLYSTAIEGSVGASSIREALNWQTVTALMILTVIGVVGHILQRRWRKEGEKV